MLERSFGERVDGTGERLPAIDQELHAVLAGPRRLEEELSDRVGDGVLDRAAGGVEQRDVQARERGAELRVARDAGFDQLCRQARRREAREGRGAEDGEREAERTRMRHRPTRRGSGGAAWPVRGGGRLSENASSLGRAQPTGRFLVVW